MIKRTTVRLPSELLKKAQRKAAAEGRTLTGLMEEGLRYVVADKPAEKRERIMPRVSSATGGYAPGIKNIRDIEEMEDLEYIEKLRRGFQ
jgi:predicted DNA-binding protein